jgi:hypothetical protein
VTSQGVEKPCFWPKVSLSRSWGCETLWALSPGPIGRFWNPCANHTVPLLSLARGCLGWSRPIAEAAIDPAWENVKMDRVGPGTLPIDYSAPTWFLLLKKKGTRIREDRQAQVVECLPSKHGALSSNQYHHPKKKEPDRQTP